MGITANIKDGFINLVNMLGTSKDPRSATQYALSVLTADQLLKAYRGNWLARRIVDALAEDATREWRDWQAGDTQIQAIEDEEKKHDIQAKVKQALVRARLFGGGALVMGINNTGDVSQELDLDSVKKGSLKYVVVMSSSEMTRGELITDLENPWFGRPRYYRINNAGVSGLEDTGSIQSLTEIHPSRVVEFIGASIPDWNMMSGANTWGDSVLQAVDEALKDYGMTISSVAAMVNDSKVDVFTIPNLTKNFVNADYENRLAARLTASNTMKSTINAIVKDKDEEWERITTQFAGLHDVMAEMLKTVAGAAAIPMTRLVGHGAGSGQSNLGSGKSGGESDLRNYYDDVSAKQRNEYGPALAALDEVLLRSATGTRDDKIYYEWAPLYIPDPMEAVDIATKKAALIKTDVDTGLINNDVLRTVRINSLIEDGTYPGLQDAIDEFGEEPEPSIDDQLMQQQLMQKSLPKQPKQIVSPNKKLTQDSNRALKSLTKRVQSLVDSAPRTLYVRRQVLNTREIMRWALNQGITQLVPASDMHVTIIYSKKQVDWMKAVTYDESTKDGTFTVQPGGVRMMDRFGDNAVVLVFGSSSLSWRHEQIKRECDASWDWEEYQPHITLSYDVPRLFDLSEVIPYRGAIRLGPEIFEEIKP